MTYQRTYDPRLKLAAKNGCIPKELKSKVTHYNVWMWRRENLSRYIGFDYYNKKEESLTLLNREVNSLKKEVEKLKAENEALGLICKIYSNIPKFSEILFHNKEFILEVIEKNKKIFKIKEFCKKINITAATYCSWKRKSKKMCNLTNSFVCLVRNSNRISLEEEEKIISLLKDDRYKNFSLTALMYFAKYENIVHASWNVWNRVKKENNVAIGPFKRKRIKYDLKEGLTANRINQYLHADITSIRLDDRRFGYIYVVQDNYSRFIKTWKISTRVSAFTRLQTFKDALSDVTSNNHKVTFVSDLGTENTAKKVAEYFDSKKNIKLLLTRDENRYANNMIERFFRDLKGMYLYALLPFRAELSSSSVKN